MKVGTGQYTKNPKRKGHSKINDQSKYNLYTLITCHPQVVQSPVYSYCLKFMFDGHIEPQLVPKLLLQVDVIELHHILVSDPNYGGLKDARGNDDNFVHCFHLN